MKLAKQLKDKEAALKKFEELAKSRDNTPDYDSDDVSEEGSTRKQDLQDIIEDSRLKNQQSKKDKLLKTILKDCDLLENEISEQLARIIQNQKKSLQNSMYMIPSELQRTTDEEEKIDLDKPRNLVKNLPKTQDLLSKISSDPKEFDDLDDSELDHFLLTEDEYKLKERLWTGLNHDFIVAQEKKRLKQETDELTGNTSGANRKKRRQGKNSGVEGIDGDFVNEMGINDALTGIGVDEATGEPLTAADSAKRMLSKKSFSKKINYATLGDLFDDNKAGKIGI